MPLPVWVCIRDISYWEEEEEEEVKSAENLIRLNSNWTIRVRGDDKKDNDYNGHY